MSRVASAPWQPNSRKLGFSVQVSAIGSTAAGTRHLKPMH